VRDQPQHVAGIGEDQRAERASQGGGVERREEIQSDADSRDAPGKEESERPLVDVRAVGAQDGRRRCDAEQRPRRRQHLHRDHERKQRHPDQAAEPGTAAQRVGEQQNRAAVRDLSRRQRSYPCQTP
jgi:hypothetical protein